MSEQVDFEDFRGGDPLADENLLKAVYPEMRRLAARLMAHERQSHTLQPTALANEALIRLLNPKRTSFKNRAEFYMVATRMMRQILVDYARSRMAAKRGGETISLDKASLRSDPDLTALEIGEALSELEKVDHRAARVLEMRFFAGLTDPEVCEVLGVRSKRITRRWPSYFGDWSPDGKIIVFTGLRRGKTDVYTIPADGDAETRLTDTGRNGNPRFSTDGKFIYFNSERGDTRAVPRAPRQLY